MTGHRCQWLLAKFISATTPSNRARSSYRRCAWPLRPPNKSFRTASRLHDEATIPTKARISLGQVNPAKPHPYGVKSFKVCDDISYCCYLKVFEGEDYSDEAPPLTMSVVAKQVTWLPTNQSHRL